MQQARSHTKGKAALRNPWANKDHTAQSKTNSDKQYWNNTEILTKAFKHFARSLNAKPENLVMLLPVNVYFTTFVCDFLSRGLTEIK